MSQEPSRQSPQSAVQATGQVASDVVAGLKQQPALLSIVVLNVIGLMVGGWILSKLIEVARDQRQQLIQIIEQCLGEKRTGASGQPSPSKLADRLDQGGKK